MAKSNKIQKPEELSARYQEAECLWNALSLSYKDRNLRQMALTNLSKRFDMSGELFWKKPLRLVAKKQCSSNLSKILEKCLWRSFFSSFNSFWKKPKMIWKITFVVTLYISDFFNTARDTAWKVSVFGVILVHIFSHWDWIRRDTDAECRYSVQTRKMRTRITPNTDTFYAVRVWQIIYD